MKPPTLSKLVSQLLELLVWQGGEVTLNGDTALEVGVPTWRTLVSYLAQTSYVGTDCPFDLFQRAKVTPLSHISHVHVLFVNIFFLQWVSPAEKVRM